MRDLVACGLARAGGGGRFDMDRRPLRAQPIDHPFAVAHDGVAALRGINQN
ncbi:MAG: hypothetical protein ACREEA_01525 [Stellaceae bacterium]